MSASFFTADEDTQKARDASMRRLLGNYPLFAAQCLKIKTKAGTIVPFDFNLAQAYLHGRLEEQKARTGRVRAILGKGRQSGGSTYIGGRFYHATSTRRGVNTFILTHEQPATDNLFGMVERFHKHNPLRVSTAKSNAKELYFDKLDSGYAVGTAGTKAIGRSRTIQRLHGSEVAFWANAAAHFGGVVQAVPDLPDTEIILESTGAGVGGEFHERWQQAEAGEGDYIAIFIPWFMTPEYSRDVPLDFVLDTEEREYAGMHRLTMPQMVWRRAKVAELKDPTLFKQEYPATAQEMFQFSGHESFITAESVVWARKATCDGIGPLVIGADPARMGKDRFSLAWRRGRKVEKIESNLKMGTIEGANWIKRVIDADDPDRVFIDLGGVGAGTFDILQSWGEPYCSVVVGVNFGGTPQDPVVILQDGTKVPGAANRRAEMWSRSRDWLTQVGGADIPDLDSLQSDACGPSFTYNMAQQLLLEPKEKMVARGIRSPDEWDSVALTFAEPVRQRRARFKENSRSGGPTGGQLGWLGT
jgi:hypothetical protein